jgi:MFS family permease
MADSRRAAPWAAIRTHTASILPALLLGLLIVYLAFNAGGYFAGEPAAAATALLLVLAGWLMLAGNPAAGVTRGLVLAAVALALFAQGRALVEFDRALLYLVALVLFGSLGGGPARLRWMIRGVALAAVAVCAVSLTTRLLPGVWPITYESLNTRLSYPLSYSNALGLLAALGVTLCVGMTSSAQEPRGVRVLACAAIPLLGSTLLLTLSRGGILVAIIGVVVFAVVGHPRALFGGLVAGGPATIIAVAYTYRADLLVSADPLTPAARDQGETVAIVVALCVIGAALLRTLLLRLDDALTAVQLTDRVRRRLLVAGVVTVAVGVLATAVAVDAPRQYDRFINSDAAPAAANADPRTRLSNARTSRVASWRVAIRQFERHPERGSGAGTYGFAWDQHRPTTELMRDGHSLYLEVLSELGLVGLTLILGTVLAIVVGVARRVRGPNRTRYATIFAACLVWAIAAGVDWHWEMAAVTLPFFALGGAALARDGTAGSARVPPLWLRGLLAGACCVLALTAPLRVAVSQDRLKASLNAFLIGRCDTANTAARDSLRAVGSRPQPYEVMAYCALVDGDTSRAVTRMGDALRRDPRNWRLHYGLARMQAMAGRDPRAAAREALRLNPLDTLTRDAVKRFARQRGSAQWRRAARGMEIVLPEV